MRPLRRSRLLCLVALCAIFTAPPGVAKTLNQSVKQPRLDEKTAPLTGPISDSNPDDLFISTMESIITPLHELLRDVDEKKYPVYQYPFDELTREVLSKKFDSGRFPLLAFGSLVSKDSAERTLQPETISSATDAIAINAKRSFSYNSACSKLGNLHNAPLAATRVKLGKFYKDTPTMLDVEFIETEGPTPFFNGKVYQLTPEDLPAFSEREVAYSLRPLYYVPWVLVEKLAEKRIKAGSKKALNEDSHELDFLRKEVNVAYVLSLPPRSPCKSSTTARVHDKYWHEVREAAEKVGKLFLHVFDRTTWLADGSTTVADFIALSEQERAVKA